MRVRVRVRELAGVCVFVCVLCVCVLFYLQRRVHHEVHRSLALPRVKVVDQRRVVHDRNAVEGRRIPSKRPPPTQTTQQKKKNETC